MESFIAYLLCVALLSANCPITYSEANVLIFVGLGEGSHFLSASFIGKELVKRGHNVTAMVSNAYGHRATDPQFSDLHFEVFELLRSLEDVYYDMEMFSKAVASGFLIWEILFNFPDPRETEFSDCDAVFQNAPLMNRLVVSHFDVVIADPLFCCGILLGHHLGAKVVIASQVAWNADIGILVGNPTNPSWIPSPGLGFLAGQMTFIHRLLNVILAKMYALSNFIVPVFEDYKRERGLVPEYSMVELYQRADLMLASIDFSFEAALPLMPHVIPVGGLTTRPANAISGDLATFVQNSGEDGILVFSLGTYVTHMKSELIDMFAEAFSRIPQIVIWQLRGTPPDTVKKRSDILTLDWLPQNDLLGHNKTRAFIFQGGINGLHEALYHGVPILVIPFFGDQNDVAARVVARGIGISLDFTKMTTDSLTQSLRDIVENKTYKEAMLRHSAIYHDRPQRPVERAAFWIEHVIKHGGKYMRSPVNDLAWYQYYLIDVIAFLFGTFFLFLLFVLYLCRCTWRFCRKLGGVKLKTN